MTKRNQPVSRSGRFAAGPAPGAAAFTQSISFDWRLWEQDILGSLAHAAMLQKIGLLTRTELTAIVEGLEAIGREIADGQFRWDPALEDVHMNIEAELTRRVPCGAKLHTGRSRNDQVALDLRMWLREEIFALGGEIRQLQGALVDLGEEHQKVLIPGYTHLQRAQPVSLAHHLLAYVEMLARDHERLVDCFHRVNVCPLGSGALAGSTLPLDRAFVARLLGFVDAKGTVRLTQNSMDAVSDRDFAVESCSVTALLAVHLSRLAEDLILWASSEFGFIRIADSFTTGSSLMPQKRNPDVAELARGKSSRVIGNLVALLVLLKGLPMTYDRDLQEDKPPVFDSMDTVRATTRILTEMLRHVTVRAEVCQAAVRDPQLLATDLVDYLVKKGVPFRQAHHIVGRAVRTAEDHHQGINELALHELQALDPHLGADAASVFDLTQAMNARNLPGAPGTRELRRQLVKWRKFLRAEQSRYSHGPNRKT